MNSKREELLRLGQVSRSYEKNGKIVEALKPVDLKLYKGEVLGIVGESGSGKTTLMKQISGIEKPDSGRIWFQSEEIRPSHRRDQKELYKHMQMIFQNASMSFNPRRKIQTSMDENLRFLSGVSGRERRRVIMEQYMELVELKPELLQRYPGELSGGQCQRAAIARALMTQPEILLCDEITSALDVIVQDRIMELLKKLADQLNVSILFISHDLALVSGFCDRIMVMKEGTCVEEGDCEEVLTNPQHEYTRKLLASILTV
ncbi:ATP-binding cassette domain-containing protein [Lacrimispora saccharolytica]|nr:ATP-binding cassette domain-containing protein [Lacrimispora saccharolytica]